MTYGEAIRILGREEVERRASDLVYMALLEENYNQKMDEFHKSVDTDIERLMDADRAARDRHSFPFPLLL